MKRREASNSYALKMHLFRLFLEENRVRPAEEEEASRQACFFSSLPPPPPPFLWKIVFSFFLFFQPVSFRERNQGLPHQTTFVRFITGGTLVHTPGRTRYCAHALAARSRESAEQRDAIGRSYVCTYLHTYLADRSYYDRVCTSFGTHGGSVVDLAPQ